MTSHKVNVRFIQAHQMYKRIPMKCKSILLDAGFSVRRVDITGNGGLFDVYCKPKPEAGVRWGHRVMVICPCGQHVPFGRMGQHFNRKRCGDTELAREYWCE